jgi:cystathionine beta-lyase
MNRDEAERYTMNFAGLETALRGGARVLAFCSPNNPTGRIWTGEELERLAWLVRKYDGYVISDEIHADLIYPGHRFLSLGELPDMADRTVTVFSPSKTFNFGGFHIATGVIPNAALRQRISDILYESGACCGRPDAMAITAQTAAYEQGGAWLDGLMEYLQKNVALVLEGLEGTPLKAAAPEASILMWINCEAMDWDTETYHRLMNRAGILPDPGHYYFMDNHAIDGYRGPQTHFRINIATPSEILCHALARLKCCL